MTDHVLQFFPDLARPCARMFPRPQGIKAFKAIHCPGLGPITARAVIPAASSTGARPASASGPLRCKGLPFRLSSRRGTVRPNKSFKPTPLRGAA